MELRGAAVGSPPQEGRAGRVRARLLRRARLPGAGARSGGANRMEVSRLGPVRIPWAPRRCPEQDSGFLSASLHKLCLPSRTQALAVSSQFAANLALYV